MYSPTSSTTSPSSTISPSYLSSPDKSNTNDFIRNSQTQQTNCHLKSKPETHNNTTKFEKPLLYETITQARVRSGYELTSRYITDLPEGSILTVKKICNNRAYIIGPIYGWVSIISKYGNQIIIPLNKYTSKIGGNVIFKKQIKQINSIKTYYKTETVKGKIIEYNQAYEMYKIQCNNGTQQWISLKDPNVQYIPKNQSMKLNEMINSSNVNPFKKSQKIFNQFFMADYPQFGNNNKNKNTNIYKCNEMKTKTKKQFIDKQLKPSVNKIEQNDQNNEMMSNTNKDKKYICRKLEEEEFINKIREIEKRIINHLHLRGFYENNPEFYRYIKKAKELAIAKAEKERQKLLQRQKLGQQTRNN